MSTKFYVFIFLLFTGFVLFGSSLNNPFIFDDESQIVKNETIQNFNIAKIFSESTFNSYGKENASGIYYKPLLTMTYALLWKIGNGTSLPFHLFQLFLGIIIAFLFYLILSFWISPILAAAMAVLFLVHSINSEVILYIANLQDNLYLLWGLLSLLLIMKNKSWIYIAICLIFSLMSKESGIIFVFAAPVISFFLNSNNKTRLILVFTASVIAFGAYSVIRFIIVEMTTLSYTTIPIGKLTWGERLLTFPKEVFYYIKTFFWPETISLHENWVVTEFSFSEVIFPLFVSIFVIWCIISMCNRIQLLKKPLGKIFLILIVLNMGLHSNIFIPLDATVANRWFYVGSLAVIGLIGLSAEQIILRYQKSAIVLFLLVFCLLSGRTYLRIQEWKSGISLFTEAVATSPNDSNYNNTLGLYYSRAGNLTKAEALFKKSIQLDPASFSAWNNIGTIEANRGNYAAAEEYFITAIKNGQYPLAIENYARLLLVQNRRNDLSHFLKDAIIVLPKNKLLLELQSQGY
ncbi:MAG: hypothetical protein A2622_06805 [Bdellovibrionales bacterium RIFCSPHIGHO2_01_FULL_40_29]|nr:MAG: hypothetical protein A2622_06805 [Bdellovibrionales bacterium RIFCSPHIGHO2_01_FULL_40_29]OFZ35150.1 MAG: hypothetical protein A3D17_07155 [Bdellovibrionales bacterium RIFCSPHIGHO2_02_FULL_40_15]